MSVYLPSGFLLPSFPQCLFFEIVFGALALGLADRPHLAVADQLALGASGGDRGGASAQHLRRVETQSRLRRPTLGQSLGLDEGHLQSRHQNHLHHHHSRQRTGWGEWKEGRRF